MNKSGTLSLSNTTPATKAPPRNMNGICVPGLKSKTMVESTYTKRNIAMPKNEAITPWNMLLFPALMSDGRLIMFENSF